MNLTVMDIEQGRKNSLFLMELIQILVEQLLQVVILQVEYRVQGLMMTTKNG